MQKDQYNEVFIAITTATIIYLTLLTSIIFSMLYFLKKKFQYAKEKGELEKQYGEQLLQSRLEMQEQTFDSISQEIHDNVGQMLSLAKLQLSIMEQAETNDKLLIADIKTNVGNALSDLRDIAKSLSTSRIQELTLLQAIEQELQRIDKTGFITCHVEVNGNEQQLPEQKKIIIFRIVQESLQNILKHANATEINVGFNYLKEQLEIVINDNGSGFELDDEHIVAHGLGLQNIFKRSILVGGNALINSSVNRGTKITLIIPYA